MLASEHLEFRSSNPAKSWRWAQLKVQLPLALQTFDRHYHFALRVDDLQAWQQYLQPLDVIFRGPVKRPDGALQLFIADPDGHAIELFTGP